MNCIGRRRCTGFTLVELMVTLAILIILTVIAVPGMTDLIRDARLSSQSDLLVSALNSARLEAIKRRKSITVCPATNANTDTACAASAAAWSTGILVIDEDVVVPVDERVIQRVQMKQGLTITTAATSVAFSGTLGSSAVTTFTLCTTERKEHQVDVTLSGHVGKRINSGTTCS
ncbi:MAG: GspH/FimT family pseudopilin [Azonexus sp.]|nr:GspH/FimT family pseudopilin [Azonexus sp.]